MDRLLSGRATPCSCQPAVERLDRCPAARSAAGPCGTRCGGRWGSVVTTAPAHVEGLSALVLLPRRLSVAGAKDEGRVRPKAPDALGMRSLEEAKWEIRWPGACGGSPGRRSGGTTIWSAV